MYKVLYLYSESHHQYKVGEYKGVDTRGALGAEAPSPQIFMLYNIYSIHAWKQIVEFYPNLDSKTLNLKLYTTK